MVLVRLSLLEDGERLRGGKAVGIHLWSPSDKPELKYPFIAYDYSMFYCVEWRDWGICEVQEGEISEGSTLYLKVEGCRRLSRRRSISTTITGLYPVRESEKIKITRRVGFRTLEIFEGENMGEALATNDTINLIEVTVRSRLIREARSRGWSISRSKYDENLLAVYAVVNGLVPDTIVEPNPRMKVLSEALSPPRRALGLLSSGW